jgi:acyl-CoA thioesterase FadM
MEFLKHHHIFPMVVELQIRYSHELNMFDDLVIRTEISKEAPYLVFRQKIYFNGSKKRASSAVVKVIFIDKGKLVRDIPEEIIEKLVKVGR